MLTALRGAGDIVGRMNLTSVFTNTPMGSFLLNSVKITVPTMLGAVALSCMTGFALAQGQSAALFPMLRAISCHSRY